MLFPICKIVVSGGERATEENKMEKKEKECETEEERKKEAEKQRQIQDE